MAVDNIARGMAAKALENQGGGSSLPIVNTATVGQTIRVSAVDENGQPTEWEAVDMVSGGGSADVDETLTVSGKAADAKAVGDAISSLSEEIANLSASGISATARGLLITVLRNGVYSSDQSANITELEAALGGSGDSGGETTVTLTSISATYSGGDVAVGTTLTDLTGIVVTAHYSDGSQLTVVEYTLSGEIAEGENSVTVTYEGKTATFTVTGVAESSGETEENNGWTSGVEYADPVWTSGYDLDKSTGELVASDTHSVSEFIPCKGVDAFSTTNSLNHAVWLYDDNKNFVFGNRTIPKVGVPIATFLTKAGKTPAYFRSVFRTSNVTLGKTMPFIVPHKFPVATPTTLLTAGERYAPEFLIDKSAWGGTEKDEVGTYCTNYIFVYGYTSITISETDTTNRKFVAFYDAEKNYISGEANNNVTRTIPDGAFYCRITAAGTLPGIKWWIKVNEADEV